MTDQNENLVLHHLRELRSEVQSIRHEFHDFRTEVRDEFGRANLRLYAIEENTAQLAALGASDRHEIDRLKARVSRIERRLELVDDDDGN